MRDFPFAIVGFDLDGTLVDTAEDLRQAANTALAEIGLPPLTPQEIRSSVGGGARRMIERGIALNGGGTLDDALFQRLYNVFIDHYTANLTVHSRPFPGAVEAIGALRGSGVALAVVTNKLEAMSVRLLEALGMAGHFATVIGRDTLGPGRAKPAPDPIHEMIARLGGGAAAFVGDSSFDVDAARAAGVASVACAFGYPDRPSETLGADAVIGHYDELVAALRALG